MESDGLSFRMGITHLILDNMIAGKLKSFMNKILKGRPEPSAMKAGQRPKSRSKYHEGGKVTRKKAV